MHKEAQGEGLEKNYRKQKKTEMGRDKDKISDEPGDVGLREEELIEVLETREGAEIWELNGGHGSCQISDFSLLSSSFCESVCLSVCVPWLKTKMT